MSSKKLNFIAAVFDVVTIFGEIEVGSTELDLDAIDAYLESPRILNDFWDLRTKEDMYQYLTDDILNGNPIWYFLKLPAWTKKMFDASFLEMVAEEEKERRRKYPCYRDCKFYRVDQVSLGDIEKCTCKELNPWNKRSTEPFKPKRKCKYYEEKEA